MSYEFMMIDGAIIAFNNVWMNAVLTKFYNVGVEVDYETLNI